MGPGAIDLTIEASGAPTCIQIGVHVLKPSYVYLLFLVPHLHVSALSHDYGMSYRLISLLLISSLALAR
jgi:hypothetical protein